MKNELRNPNDRFKGPLLFVVLFLLVFSIGVFSKDAKVLRLKDAVDLTLKHNPSLLKYANTVLSTKYTLEQRKNSFLPDLKFSGDYSKNYFKTADETGGFYGDQSGTFSLNLSSSLVLFDGFFNISKKKQALLMYKSSKQNYSRAEQQVIYQTILNYLDVVLSEELIRVGNENLKTQQLLLARIKDFFKSGKKAAVDLHYQLAEIANTQYQLLNFENNLKLAKVKLREGMGLSPSLDFDVKRPEYDDPKGVIDLNKMDLFALAKKNRSDIKSAKFDINAATQGIKSAKSGYYPKVLLIGKISSRYSNQSDLYSFSDQLLRNNPSASIGISVSVPIFDKGVTKNQVSQAKLDLENNRIELDRINNQISGDLIKAESDYRTALKQIDVAKTKLTYSKTALESILERYNVNAATISELSQTRAQYLQSQYDQVEASLNLYKQGITLLYQIGDLEQILNLIK